MKPTLFPQANKVLTPPDQKYSANVSGVSALPIWSDGEQCVSCWELSLWDRLRVLIFGRIWASVLSGHTQPPIALSVQRKYFKDAPKPE